MPTRRALRSDKSQDIEARSGSVEIESLRNSHQRTRLWCNQVGVARSVTLVPGPRQRLEGPSTRNGIEWQVESELSLGSRGVRNLRETFRGGYFCVALIGRTLIITSFDALVRTTLQNAVPWRSGRVLGRYSSPRFVPNNLENCDFGTPSEG